MIESNVPLLSHSGITIPIQGEDICHTREEVSDGGATDSTGKLKHHSNVLDEDGE